MENMLDLLDEEPEVKDDPGAPDLLAATGKIEFRDVSFGYSAERTILKNLSFTAMPGQTVAFVSTHFFKLGIRANSAKALILIEGN